jgi:hypothetical protein
MSCTSGLGDCSCYGGVTGNPYPNGWPGWGFIDTGLATEFEWYQELPNGFAPRVPIPPDPRIAAAAGETSPTTVFRDPYPEIDALECQVVNGTANRVAVAYDFDGDFRNPYPVETIDPWMPIGISRQLVAASSIWVRIRGLIPEPPPEMRDRLLGSGPAVNLHILWTSNAGTSTAGTNKIIFWGNHWNSVDGHAVLPVQYRPGVTFNYDTLIPFFRGPIGTGTSATFMVACVFPHTLIANPQFLDPVAPNYQPIFIPPGSNIRVRLLIPS